MASLFIPGVPLTADQFNTRIRDELNARITPTSQGEFSDGTTQSVASSTNHAPYEASASLDATEEQWQQTFTSSLTSRPRIPEAGLYLLSTFGKWADQSGEWTSSVQIRTTYSSRKLASASFQCGTPGGFSLTTVEPLPSGVQVYVTVGQASGVSVNLAQFGFWVVKLSDQAYY